MWVSFTSIGTSSWLTMPLCSSFLEAGMMLIGSKPIPASAWCSPQRWFSGCQLWGWVNTVIGLQSLGYSGLQWLNTGLQWLNTEHHTDTQMSHQHGYVWLSQICRWNMSKEKKGVGLEKEGQDLVWICNQDPPSPAHCLSLAPKTFPLLLQFTNTNGVSCSCCYAHCTSDHLQQWPKSVQHCPGFHVLPECTF